MKIILWAVLIIFLIGLLVVTGVFKMILVMTPTY
ncbi:small membrane protein YohP [Shigella flexneri]